jgi:hypothetical protein
MKYLTTTFLILCCIFLFGCNQSKRKLVDGYVLERFDENGKYYLVSPETELSGGGAFDGTIQEIGWNQDWILAQVTRIYRGDTDGWYALNLKTKQIIGPIQDSELKTNSTFLKIGCRSPADVFAGKN